MDYKKRTSDSDVLIAEGAVVVGDVTLSKGVSVWYNAVIRGSGGLQLHGGALCHRPWLHCGKPHFDRHGRHFA